MKKRVLIVDDAVVVRKSLSRAIDSDPDLEVAGLAANGRIALSLLPTAKPDIVLLDIEMPEMDGLETVREMRKLDVRVPIIMFSTLSENGAAATFDALALGATDYVAKPSNADMGSTMNKVSRELIPKIRALCQLPELSSSGHVPSKPSIPAERTQTRTRLLPPAQVVAIGVSTGGPDALAQVMPLLPASLAVPIVIAQHMPRAFTSMLAARLSRKSALPVRECESGELVAPGCAFLAPGDTHMIVEGGGGAVHLQTHHGPKENFCRPSVDVLFRSVANTYGSRALAVVLTGMGRDGLSGCEILREKGARIIVQDEATSVVWGMPGYVARAGLADKILPLDQIGLEIVRATTPQLAERT